MISLGSCVKDYECDLVVEKPESVQEAEQIASLDVLKSYIDRAANPNFTLGISVNSDDYASQALTYSIAKTNFDAVIDGSALAYGATVADDGTASFESFRNMLLEDAPSVLGGTLLAHDMINKTQLEQVISANFIKGDFESGKLTLADFDSDAVGTVYEMTNGSVATIVEDPAGQSGNVLQIGSPENKAKNSYAIIPISLPQGITLGNLHTITFDIYCVDDNSRKKNLVLFLNGVRKNFTGDTPDKRGCPKDDWGRKLIDLDATECALTDEDRALSSFTLSLGPNVVNSYYYIDNITATWETGEKDKYVEKTDEEKSQALAENFDTWANALMTITAPSTNEYVVLANPMSDDDSYMLRNLENETALGIDTESSFFFNDYMGDNYLVKVTNALKAAYTTAGGTAPLKLYVKESNLLGNPGKVQRLLEQIKLWQAAGAQIDGIAVDLSLAYSVDEAEQKANTEAVDKLFEALGASGLIIRLDNVNMANANPDYYAYVIGKYFSNVTGDKRGGIIFAGTSDLWKDATRTSVYQAIVNSLKL